MSLFYCIKYIIYVIIALYRRSEPFPQHNWTPTQWRHAPLQLVGQKEQILFGHELCFQRRESDFSVHQGNRMNQFYMELKAQVWHAAGEKD